MKKETGLPIKCLRTDRGGEYNSTLFNKICKQNGIKRQLTMAYTPQENGVAERKIRTVMNLVRSMLSEKNAQDFLASSCKMGSVCFESITNTSC